MEAKYHDLEGLIEDYNKVNIEFTETKEKIADLEEKLKPFQEKLDVLYEEVGEIARNTYMGGAMSGMTAVLTTGSADTLADRMTLLDQITVDDHDAIAALNDAKSDLDEQKRVLDGLYATQSKQDEELRGKKETIETDLERLSGERDKAYRDSRGLGPGDFTPPYVPGKRGEVVRFALKQTGKPYVFAAAGPGGWDCSGLTLGAWSQVGVNLPHNAEAQWNMVQHISRDQLKPGDLVFYNGLSHVALYIGDGHIVHAATNNNNVQVTTIEKAATDYYGAGRIPGW
ncbi:hypothetical protein Afil01_25950 [Actinorhabdospora filicis]|uniref:NlpC/P60 domain-containing protein n=2 Tax=Actinorhabdospora filicis TaxID=1785913 RepID=A0A9W6SKR2_9ACTN|nr:hypothetical protein Afil01_25950 [Actinorhabdospora filicis]